MRYAELLAALQEHRSKELIFEFAHGSIRRDYHITEVLSSVVQAIDCGGAVDNWNEVVLQLLEPRHREGERYMEANKALGILEKSSKLIDLHGDAKLFLEYKAQNSLAAQRFTVSGIEVKEGRLIVEIEGATTQCKAVSKNPSVSGETSSCCASSRDADGSAVKIACCG